MTQHAILSASAAERWLNCTPSARLTEKLPDTSSIYAKEGTLAHSFGELELRYNLNLITKNAYEKELKIIKTNELYNENMLEEIEKYTGFVMERLAEVKAHTKDPIIFLEQRLDFSKYVPEGFGTGDCIIIADNIMDIIDLKYGKGVEVSAENNPQMKLYALGAIEEYGFIYDILKVRMTIVQPRLDNISTWEITVTDLETWAKDDLIKKASLAWEGKGDFVAGDWCKFCKVKATCKTRKKAVLAIGEKYNMQDPNLLSVEEIAEILHKAEEIQAWAKDIQEYALDQALNNNVKYPGWKLVEGRSNRKYSDEDQVAAILMQEGYEENTIYSKKLKGITDMEKVLGKKVFNKLLQNYIIKPPGKPTLVVESDKRPELNSAESDFDL